MDGPSRGITPLVVFGPTAEVQEAYEGGISPLKEGTTYNPPQSAPIDGNRKAQTMNLAKQSTNEDKPMIDRAQMMKILDQAEACKEAMKKKKRKFSKKHRPQSLAENPF